jgi:hypothetical protein
MDTNTLENALNPNDSEATYRALRDSILQIYQFGTKIAKEANPDNELQVSWELGDTSLMNWISDTHCYLSRKGQKLQFLARPSKLEIISFSLEEGDKLLICSDSLRQNLSDNEIDEILQESNGSENSCQNLLKIANVNNNATGNSHNIVVMEVINNQSVITPTPIVEANKVSKNSSKLNSLWIILPIALLVLGGVLSWLWTNKSVDIKNLLSGNSSNIAMEDTLKFINKDSLELAKANDTITKEFEDEKKEVVSPEQKDDFVETPPKDLKSEKDIRESSASNDTFTNNKTSKSKSENSNKKSNSEDSNSTSTKSVSNDSPKSVSLTSSNEEENYNALLQQKERWVTIKNDLQNTFNSGNIAATEKLKNSERVLERIEKKLQESGKKLGKN